MEDICSWFEHSREGSREGRVGKIKTGKKKKGKTGWVKILEEVGNYWKDTWIKGRRPLCCKREKQL